MRPTLVLLALAVVTAVPDRAHGLQAPSFDLDKCSWTASHIVVVTEGDKIDGDVEVLESWKGDLKKGDKLIIPELAAFAPEKERVVSPWLLRDKLAPGDATHVTCSRIILFLVKNGEKKGAVQPARIKWGAAGMWQEMYASMVWIEKGQAYAFAQEMNPGGCLLHPWRKTEREVKHRVDQVINKQEELSKALSLGDPADLSDRAIPVLNSAPEFTPQIIEAIGKAGPKALTILRTLADDESLKDHQWRVFPAMAAAGGECAGAELTQVLKEELAFWKKVGPGLKGNWWGGEGLAWAQVEPLRNRYSRTLAVVEALKTIQYAPCRQVVADFRAYWCAQPQLAFKGNDRVGDTCDAILTGMR